MLMWIEVLQSKIHGAKITATDLHYEGSISLDANLLSASGIRPYQKVDVLNLSNGIRLQTYAIAAKAGSGSVCLNGPAARCAVCGDKVIVLSYAMVSPEEAAALRPIILRMDDHNQWQKEA